MNEFYLNYFGLDQRPFTLLPDPEFLYWSEQHRRGEAEAARHDEQRVQGEGPAGEGEYVAELRLPGFGFGFGLGIGLGFG